MKQEIKRIFHSKMLMATLVAVSILPLIYGGLYLWAFWDPYGNIKNIPVAVVNNDAGAVKDSRSGAKSYNFGNTIVDELKKDRAMDWHFVTLKEAETGLKDRRYYTEIIIPQDFSEHIISAGGDNPEKANIVFISRQASSFMAAKFSDSVFVRFKSALTEKISKEYLDNIFSETRDSTADLQKAVDGTGTLNNGLDKAKKGSVDILNGMETFGSNLSDLHTGLKSLSDGSVSLHDGFNVIQPGETVSFSDGIDEADNNSSLLLGGVQNMQAGIMSLDSGINQLQAGVRSLTAGSKQGLGGSAGVIQLLNQYVSAHPEATADAAFAQAVVTAQAVNTGEDQIYQGLVALETNLNLMKVGSTNLVGGSTQLSSGMTSMVSGLTEIKKGKDSLNSGANDLKNGLADASNGSQKLLDGLETLKAGQKDLVTGLRDAKDGTQELRDKLVSAFNSLLAKTDPDKNTKQSAMMSAPVDIHDSSIDLVQNNGTGFTPYFVPLSFWVGSMAILFLVDFSREKNKKPKALTGKIVVSFIVCAIQSALLDLVMLKALHLKVNHLSSFILFNLFLACTFMSIQIFLSLTLELAGKFVGIIILMLQLTTSAGTYPFETIPAFFQKINPWLPMTYAVSALKEIVSGDNFSIVFQNTRTILIYQIIFIALSFVYIIKPITLLVNHYHHEKR